MRLSFPEETRQLLKALTAKTRYYLATPQVQDILIPEHRHVFEEWIIAQEVLERLAFMPGPHELGLTEADHVLNLVVATTLFNLRKGDRWEYSAAMLLLVARFSLCQLEPLKAVAGGNRNRDALALECYERIRATVGAKPSWVSVREIYFWWIELHSYGGKDPNIIKIERKLGTLCKPFRLAFEKL